MLESSLSTPSFLDDLFTVGPFQDVIGGGCDALFDQDCLFTEGPFQDVIGGGCDTSFYQNDQSDFLSNYDSISSNSSDIDAYNLEDFEDVNLVSEEFCSHLFGEEELSGFSHIDNYNQSTSYPSSLNNSNTSFFKKNRSECSQQSIKSWSSMSAEEQDKTLREISDTTCGMGISEQIAVIRIMKPSAEISAEMTEFTLDPSFLNDTKLKKVQNYFKRHKKPVKSRKSSKARKLNSSVSRTSKKPRQKQKEKALSETEDLKRLRRKQQRQGRKEEKSGLFVYEKVVKFSRLEEDEDVNILE